MSQQINAQVAVGSKSEELSLSICLPGYRLEADVAQCSRHVAKV